jgi:uncharacterized short protein YbdD (DUF466 family)
MGILAVYDTVGIQNYIFSSNKLAENVGASKLAADIFRTLLPDVIHIFEARMPKWREGGALNPGLKAEIIYQGGGNAYVAFADHDTFQGVTKTFLTEVRKLAPGIGVAVSAIETDFSDYRSDFEKLNKRLTLVKGGFNSPVFGVNQPITKQSGRTGLPAGVLDGNEYLDISQSKKRARYTEYKAAEAKKGNDIRFVDFDDLTFDKGSDSLIAIIHVDGNNMGNRIKAFMEDKALRDYAEAVPAIRKLARAIDDCYEQARKKTLDAFENEYAKHVAEQRKKNPGKEYPERAPVLELIGDGDDTTLVICGRFALDFAARLLREIENRPDPFGKGKKPAACAGVVIFHSHYPFSEAYKLAEELCSNAKKPSRDPEYSGSYIDFHLHQSGNVASLSRLRDMQYKVGVNTILRRPWRITEGKEDVYPNFKWFEENTTLLKNGAKYPRNKTKAIRNAIGVSDYDAELAENRLRGEKLPRIPIASAEELAPEKDKTGGNTAISRYAAQFDILELCDVYENLLNKEVAAK